MKNIQERTSARPTTLATWREKGWGGGGGGEGLAEKERGGDVVKTIKIMSCFRSSKINS